MPGERKAALVSLAVALAAALVAAPSLWLPGRIPIGFDADPFLLPLLRVAATSVHELTSPTWTDMIGAGFPLVASMQALLLYPPTWLLMLLEDPGQALGAWLFAHLVLAGAFGFGLGRRLGLSTTGAWTCAGLMAGSPAVIGLLNRPEFLVAFAWAPLAYCAALDRRAGPGRALRLGLALGMTATISPQMAFAQTAVAMAVHVVVAATGERRVVPLVSGPELALTIGLTLALAAPALFSLASLLPESDRALGALYSSSPKWNLGPGQLSQWLAPGVLGVLPFGLGAQDAGGGLYAQFVWVTTPLLAAAGLGLAAVSFVHQRPRRLLAIVVVGFVLASPNVVPGVEWLWNDGPLSMIRFPAKAWCAVLPLALLLVACGVDIAARHRARAIRWTLLVAGVAVVGVLLPPEVWSRIAAAGGQSLAGQTAAEHARLAMVVAAGPALVVAALLRWVPKPRRWIALVVVVEAAAYGHGALRTATLEQGSTPVADAARRLADPGPARLTALEGLHNPAATPADAKERLQHHHRFGARNHLLGQGVALDVANTGIRLEDPNWLHLVTLPHLDARARALGTHGLIIGSDWAPTESYRLEASFPEAGLSLYRTEPPPPDVYVAERVILVEDRSQMQAALQDTRLHLSRDAVIAEPVQAEGGPAEVSQLERDVHRVSFRISAPAPRLVWTADAMGPGWSVLVDDESASAVKVHGALRGVVVPAGDHLVTWQHTDPALRQGLLASLALAALLGWLWFAQRRRRQAP